MKRIFLVIACLSIIISSCRFFGGRTVRGNGISKSESRTVGSFTNVEVSGNFNAYIKQDSTSSVRVEADEDLMQYIEVFVEGNTLVVRPKDHMNLRSSNGIKVYISNSNFESFDATGASDIIGENKINSSKGISFDASGASEITMDLHAPSVKAELSGASYIRLNGETKDFSVDASGASNIRCFGLSTENANIDVSGASHADVFASVKLDVNASGASEIKYKGNASIQQESSGASSVKKAQ